MLGLAAAYLILPVDIIPDIGLPLGIVDDTIIAAAMIGLGGRIIYNKVKAEQNGQKASNDDDVIDL